MKKQTEEYTMKGFIGHVEIKLNKLFLHEFFLKEESVILTVTASFNDMDHILFNTSKLSVDSIFTDDLSLTRYA